MDKTIFFQSSLPRAGSTLLQNIIAQNPYFYSTPTSGMADLTFSAYRGFHESLSFKNEKDYALITDSFYDFCRGGINSFYKNITSKPYILDKNRGWLEQYYFLKKLYPNFKMVCMVRDIRDIISSLEKLHRTDIDAPFRFKPNVDYRNFKIKDRVKSYATEKPLMPTLLTLQEFIETNNLKNIHFIKFEELCLYPHNVLKNLYNFFELPYYEFHNFNEIKQITWENDNFISYGSHKISSSLSLPSSDYNNIIGKDNANDIFNSFKWFFEYFNYPQQ